MPGTRPPTDPARTRALLLFGSMVVIMLGLPLLLVLPPPPIPVQVPSLAGQRVGVYLDTGRGLYKVFPQPAGPGFPRHALLTGSHPVAYVRYRQRDRLEAYGICRLPRGERVPVSRHALPGRVLRIAPRRPLPAGRYLAVISREGMWGGNDYYYFRVK